MVAPLSAQSRLTVFPLEGLRVAYTTQSCDSRGLGDIAVVGVVEPAEATGDHLWRLAGNMFTNPPPDETQARWLLTQCTRARMVVCTPYEDLPDAKWTAELTRTLRFSTLFANHTTLRTGRLTIH